MSETNGVIIFYDQLTGGYVEQQDGAIIYHEPQPTRFLSCPIWHKKHGCLRSVGCARCPNIRFYAHYDLDWALGLFDIPDKEKEKVREILTTRKKTVVVQKSMLDYL